MDFFKERELMVEHQIRARGIHNRRLLKAFLKVERHLFVPKSMTQFAYYDHPLSIGYGQTISQPYIVALMIELLELNEDDIVLEIGTGSGYQTALLAELSKYVYSIERIEPLARSAEERLRKLGYKNIIIKVGDGTLGWTHSDFSMNENVLSNYKEVDIKFDAIVVSAAAPEMPQKLIEQLADNGRMVIPYGKHFSQDLLRISKRNNKIKRENFGGCMFVPLIGEHGWKQ
ncbi:MAG: protein-L-isoaspartate O-methyltransferase [Candidatus Cloacimonadota bacterium]|nr:protein-L-isoaspartate O-methyltransferase [Candidatus Cloacimonadota bacterium]